MFTNVAETSDGGLFWEGLEKEINNDVTIESCLWDTRGARRPQTRPPPTPTPGKQIMHDPFGYNFGDYLKHWLTLGKKENAKLPKIFHVKLPKIFHIKLPKIFHANNGFLWPGFGEDIAKRTAIILCPSSSR